MKRRWDITHLFEDGKRLILKTITFHYRFISETPIDNNRPKVSVYGTTWISDLTGDIKTVCYEHSLRIPIDQYGLHKPYWTTEIIQLSDKNISGLFVEIDNDEYIYLEEMHVVVGVAPHPTGVIPSTTGYYEPEVDFVILSTDPVAATYNSLEDIEITFNLGVDATTAITSNITFVEV